MVEFGFSIKEMSDDKFFALRSMAQKSNAQEILQYLNDMKVRKEEAVTYVFQELKEEKLKFFLTPAGQTTVKLKILFFKLYLCQKNTSL